MVKGIEVAGEAGGGREATDRLQGRAGLVLMDLSMPDFDGIEAMRKDPSRTARAARR
jgi:CheY-like chemotaxis protein